MFSRAFAVAGVVSSLSTGERFSILQREPVPSTVANVVYVDTVIIAETEISRQRDELACAVADKLGVSIERARALSEIGAVWYREAHAWRRYWPTTTTLATGRATSLRVYPRPRRFSWACDSIEWKDRLLYVDGAFVVVDKPAMLPTQPDNANAVECLAACCSRGIPELGILRAAHRLDTVVSGCCVLARNLKALKSFAGWSRARKIRKTYVALAKAPPPLGELVHDMFIPATTRDRARADEIFGPGPRLIREPNSDNRGFDCSSWKRCRLVVNEVHPSLLHDGCFEVTLRLITGRPHQIRAQLAAVGAPIVNDSLYSAGPAACLFGSDDRGVPDVRGHLSAPTLPIGLVAQAIAFAGRDVALRYPPWWRYSE